MAGCVGGDGCVGLRGGAAMAGPASADAVITTTARLAESPGLISFISSPCSTAVASGDAANTPADLTVVFRRWHRRGIGQRGRRQRERNLTRGVGALCPRRRIWYHLWQVLTFADSRLRRLAIGSTDDKACYMLVPGRIRFRLAPETIDVG